MLLYMEADSLVPAFSVFGPTPPVRAVIFSVPHAGRYYPPELIAVARVPRQTLERLEDRYADQLVVGLDHLGWSGIVAQWARAWVDLNRSEKDVDGTMVMGRPMQFFPQPSEKVRGGLGLFPRRLGRVGELWRTHFDWQVLQARVESLYRPYHQSLSALLDCALKQHGAALLLDVHSMPPLSGHDAAQIVIGDRHGVSAPHWLSNLVLERCREAGFFAVLNKPYAGGYITERHACPNRNRYALQIEIDRSLYINEGGELIWEAVDKIRAMLNRIAGDCSEWMEQGPPFSLPEAAE